MKNSLQKSLWKGFVMASLCKEVDHTEYVNYIKFLYCQSNIIYTIDVQMQKSRTLNVQIANAYKS